MKTKTKTTTMKIEGTGTAVKIDCKRMNLPYKVIDTCPSCSKPHEVDLSDRHYVSYPSVGGTGKAGSTLYFCCDHCDHEWQRKVAVEITLTALS